MRFKLLGKMLLYIMGPAVVGLAILAVLASSFASKGFTLVTDRQLEELARVQAAELNKILEYLQVVAGTTGHLSAIRDLAVESNSPDSTKEGLAHESDRVGAYLKKLSEDYPDIGAVFVVNKDGLIIAHSAPNRIGVDLNSYESIKKALAGKEAVETRVSARTKTLNAFLTSPVLENGRVVGAVGISIDLLALNAATTGTIKLSKSTVVYVYDGDAQVIMNNVGPEHNGTSEAGYPYAQEILKMKNGHINYEWEGVDKVGHFAYVPMMDWIVIFASETDDLMSTVISLRTNIIIIATIMSIVVSLIIFFVAKGISNALGNNSRIATYVAEGNLTLTKEQEGEIEDSLRRQDEISELAQGIRTMIKNLARMVFESESKTEEARKAMLEAEASKQAATEAAIKASSARKEGLLDAAAQLEDIVAVIATASEQLAAQVDRSSRGADEQAERMVETATAMDEMNSTVLEVARNSSTSAEITENTRQKAIEGAGITQKCKESMILVREESLSLRSNMSTLANHAQSINTVMRVISDIADQTNLLALNAAIEAARAGDAGRGFAVVADEVRKLAEKTKNSTTDVATAIAGIQESTETNVKQVDLAVQCIEEATELANQSGEALQGILEMADLSADGVRAIATASEEQSATSDEIANAIGLVNGIAVETTAAMVEASQAVAALTTQSNELSRLVTSLKSQ